MWLWWTLFSGLFLCCIMILSSCSLPKSCGWIKHVVLNNLVSWLCTSGLHYWPYCDVEYSLKSSLPLLGKHCLCSFSCVTHVLELWCCFFVSNWSLFLRRSVGERAWFMFTKALDLSTAFATNAHSSIPFGIRPRHPHRLSIESQVDCWVFSSGWTHIGTISSWKQEWVKSAQQKIIVIIIIKS